MSDLISRNALLEEFKKCHISFNGTPMEESDMMISYRSLARVINRQPPVEAKTVIHGEWKRIGSGSLHDTYECTNCHRPPKWDCLGDNHWRIAFTDICPHCGADMRKKVQDE